MPTNTTVPSGRVSTLRSVAIQRMDWLPVDGCPGVSAKVLARDTDIVGTLIMYEPQARTPGHPHPIDQYIWVVSGEARIAGRWLDAGSGAHVPAGVDHPIVAGEANGCTLLQVQSHRRADPAG